MQCTGQSSWGEASWAHCSLLYFDMCIMHIVHCSHCSNCSHCAQIGAVAGKTALAPVRRKNAGRGKFISASSQVPLPDCYKIHWQGDIILSNNSCQMRAQLMLRVITDQLNSYSLSIKRSRGRNEMPERSPIESILDDYTDIGLLVTSSMP